MKKIFISFIVIFGPAYAVAQPSSVKPDWSAFQFLLGNWSGDGSGQPGQGTGSFTFSFDLQEMVIVRRNQTDYPATNSSPAFSHSDLMIIYRQPNLQTQAIYFDNEGHKIQYKTNISADGKSITFISDSLPAQPRFQLTYASFSADSLLITFEIAPPNHPHNFSKYLEGRAHRIATPFVVPSENKKK